MCYFPSPSLFHGLETTSVCFVSGVGQSLRGILIAEVSARDGGWYVRSGGRPPPRYVRNGRCLKEKSLFEQKKIDQ